MVTQLETRMEGKSMARGRRPKAVVKPKTSERMEALRAALLNLPSDLRSGGFDSCLPKPNTVEMIHDPVSDTGGGWIGHVEEPLGVILQRVSVDNNFNQRPPFDHANDPIYRRLIRDFIQGAAMPESKVAALVEGPRGPRAKSLDAPDIYYSIIDGLQRLYCYGLALLLVWRREALVKDGLITQEAWDYYSDHVAQTGEVRTATEALLGRLMRYEIFFNIDLEGLLHYMVTFNTAQRRMSLAVQLEIMSGPLIKGLENFGITIWKDISGQPGTRKPREQFAAADLILACEAFITADPQVAAAKKAEQFHSENKGYLDDVGDINDVGRTLKRITTELHPEIMRVYADDSTKRSLLSDRATFFHSLVAACGYIRNRQSMKALEGALDKLLDEVRKPVEDPLRLDAYLYALATITTSRGKAMRGLVNDTFSRFFNGATVRLEWEDTAKLITG